jgi:hypothetical protein
VPHHAGLGSLYVYVSEAPPSYEHAHTSTAVVRWHSLLPYSQHTAPAVGAAPTDGWAVLSQPGASVPHLWLPGASVGIR